MFDGPCRARRGRHDAGDRIVTRPDGRAPDELRPVSWELGFQEWAAGSVLFSMGKTRVLVAASVSDERPRWLKGTGNGWVTGEYSMLPASTNERSNREVNRGRPGGRTQEIQRLIGRSLRSVTDLSRLGERTITIDCDVLQADAGTRTASITGGYIALAIALRGLAEPPVRSPTTARRQRRRRERGHRRRRSAARPLLRRGRRRRRRLQRGHDGLAATSSRCRAPPKARRSRGPSSTRCSTWPPPASRELTKIQQQGARAAERVRGLPRPRRDRLAQRAQAARARPDLCGLAGRVGHGREPRPAPRSPRWRRRATPTSRTPC